MFVLDSLPRLEGGLSNSHLNDMERKKRVEEQDKNGKREGEEAEGTSLQTRTRKRGKLRELNIDTKSNNTKRATFSFAL